jgi:hypothetical protein
MCGSCALWQQPNTGTAKVGVVAPFDMPGQHVEQLAKLPKSVAN